MNDENVTCLHVAAYAGHKEIVKLLIAKGADVNAKEENGDTPLDVSMEPIENLENIQTSKKSEEERRATADLLRKHGGKTGEELKAEGK